MQVQYKLVIGESEYVLTETVESPTDFFKKLHFYSTFPKVGPNGETDLVLTYRRAEQKYDYYSIVSQKAQMEYKFGQPKEGTGLLYPKGWEPLYKADSNDAQEAQSAVSSGGGLGASAASKPQASKPAASAATSVGLGGLGGLKLPSPAATPQAAVAQAPAAPEVQQKVANVLSKFGI